jgi:O-antigen/teichoic acid export membrane protein
VGVVLAYSGFGIWSLIAYNIASILLAVIFMNFIPELRLHLGLYWENAKELYSFSLKILGTNLISSGGDTIRTLTIGKVYSPNQLAFFDRGLSYSSLVTQVVNTSISSVLLSTFSRSQENIQQLQLMVRRSVGMSSYIMIPLLVFVAIVAKPLVGIVLSEKWIPCAIYLSIFCILRIPGIITSIDKQVFYALGNSQIGLFYEIGLLLANLISLFFMLSYGPIAIAIGFTVIEYFGNFVLCLIASKVYGYSLADRIKDLFLPVINSIVLFIFCYSVYYLKLNSYYTLLLQFVVGVASYYYSDSSRRF